MRHITRIGFFQVAALLVAIIISTTAAAFSEASCSNSGRSQVYGYVNGMTANATNAWFGYNNPYYGTNQGGTIVVNWQALDAYGNVVASGSQNLTLTSTQIGGSAYTGNIDPSITWSDIQLAFAGTIQFRRYRRLLSGGKKALGRAFVPGAPFFLLQALSLPEPPLAPLA